MAKQLSEQLADLSVHVKKAEDAEAAAKKETHDKIMSRWEQARADATATTDKVHQRSSPSGTVSPRTGMHERRKSPPTWRL